MAGRIIQQDAAAGTAHSNSTTEASVARKTFAAGELTAGKLFRIVGLFRCTATNSTDTATPALRWGTSSTVTSNTLISGNGAVDVANDDVSFFNGHLHVQTATRAVLYGSLSNTDADGIVSPLHFGEVLTIVPETAYNLDVTMDWSVASASNSVQSESFVVYEVT